MGAIRIDGADIPTAAEVVFQPRGPRGRRAFTLGKPGVYARRDNPIDILVVHWNGSERGPAAIYRTLRKRGLSVEFAMDAQGRIEQWADPGLVFCSHARGVNIRAIGIELQNPGSYTWERPDGRPLWSPSTIRRMRKRVPRQTYVGEVNGERRAFAAFTAAQVQALTDFTTALCAAGVIDEPRLPLDVNDAGNRCAAAVRRERLSDEEIKNFRGVLGHYHVAAHKLDPGPQILELLRERLAVSQ